MNNIPNYMYLTVAVVLILSVAAVCIWRIIAQALVRASEVQVDIIELLTKRAENTTYSYNGGRERHAQATAATTAAD